MEFSKAVPCQLGTKKEATLPSTMGDKASKKRTGEAINELYCVRKKLSSAAYETICHALKAQYDLANTPAKPTRAQRLLAELEDLVTGNEGMERVHERARRRSRIRAGDYDERD